MLNLQILVAELRGGVLDANTIIRRAPPEDSPSTTEKARPSAPDLPLPVPSGSSGGIGSGLQSLGVSSLKTSVIIGSGDDRGAFAQQPELQRPAVYGLLSATRGYYGRSKEGSRRVGWGQQPIEDIETIFVITDANNTLTAEDAKVCERILWSRAAAFGDRDVVNGVPDGAPVDPERYAELELFMAEACLGILFTCGSTRNLIAGPRSEPERLGALRPFNEPPEGEIFEMQFAGGLVALAARQSDDSWLLLRGSDVRADTVPSANASASYLRASWSYAGLLETAADGNSLVVKRDLSFDSASAAAHFCTGSKGRGRAGWQTIDTDGGYDPATPALIAG
ncbi:MAG: hypothetical protein EOP19_13270 [Hyphomicrobiales bacterium]|nr:MAG: hypothetical protein EOP19_13270 [Hyphomicrobiales bacterium]